MSFKIVPVWLCLRVEAPLWNLILSGAIKILQIDWLIDWLIFAARCSASAAYFVMRCLSVCLSRSWILSKRINIFKILSPSVSQAIPVFFRNKRHGNIPTGTRLTGTSNAGGVGRRRDSEPISGFTACCQRCDRLGVVNTRRRTTYRW